MRVLNPSRVVAALAIVALAAGTALAASPSPSPDCVGDCQLDRSVVTGRLGCARSFAV